MRLIPRTKKARLALATLALLASGLVVYLVLVPFVRYSQYEPEEGDIVFQSLPRVALVRTIQGATHSPYSHCGVVAREDGEWIVIESLGKVKKTGLFRWVLQGRGGRFAVYRLKEPYRQHIPRFLAELRAFLGTPYDRKFGMDDEALYCSELVYKAYRNATGEELGSAVRLGDLDWQPYEETIRDYEGGPAPLDRLIITPRHLSEADQLDKALSAGL